MEALIGHLPRTHTQLYSDSRTKNAPYGNAVDETNPVLGSGIYGYIISRFGLQNKDNAVGDKYYLAIDSSGHPYGGAQVNGASTISWNQCLTMDILYTKTIGISDSGSDHAKTIKDIWNKLPNDMPFICRGYDDNRFLITGFVYDGGNYGAVLYLSYNSCGIVQCNARKFSDIKLT